MDLHYDYKPQQRSYHCGNGYYRAVKREFYERQLYAVIFQHSRPHYSRKRSYGSEERAEVGADNGRIHRRLLTAHKGREKHAHGNVVYKVRA